MENAEDFILNGVTKLSEKIQCFNFVLIKCKIFFNPCQIYVLMTFNFRTFTKIFQNYINSIHSALKVIKSMKRML